jgi:cyclopropane-fatty-acyl-phospholipid synthase
VGPGDGGTGTVSATLEVDAGRAAPEPDLSRWPSLAPPTWAPLRAALARRIFRGAARRAGLCIRLPEGVTFGDPAGPVMDLVDPTSFFTRLGRSGKVGFGESFMAGEWDAPDLAETLEALARQIDVLVPPKLQWLRRFFESRPPDQEHNDRPGARRNVARHYDLSNELFSLFLDETMTYSSALFAAGAEDTLAEAQARKIERLLDVTGVAAGTRVLEIGTGWGELALRAARRGAWVTSVTLSHEQAKLARARVARAGLSGAVDIRVEDYRDLEGEFDAIVSVEMLEAVGEHWWPSYFRILDDHLAPSGRAGVQTILMAHDRLLATKGSWTWIRKYIFPGGLIPSETAIRAALAASTTLRVVDRLEFGESYATTLRRWRDLFDARATDVEELGFDRTFQRMWRFYLAYSEAGFRSGYLDVAQFVLGREETEVQR